jgi:hypothetical protein
MIVESEWMKGMTGKDVFGYKCKHWKKPEPGRLENQNSRLLPSTNIVDCLFVPPRSAYVVAQDE